MAKRIVDTAFWEQGTVVDQYTPEDKYFMLYLLTNKNYSLIGIYTLPPRLAVFDMGYSAETIEYLIQRFEKSMELHIV